MRRLMRRHTEPDLGQLLSFSYEIQDKGRQAGDQHRPSHIIRLDRHQDLEMVRPTRPLSGRGRCKNKIIEPRIRGAFFLALRRFPFSHTTRQPPIERWEMKRMPYKSDPGIIAALIALGMTVLGSVAAYAYKVLSGETFSWRTLCLQLIVSLFAGLLMMMLATYWNWPQELTGAICGMAGWSGSSLVKALEKRFLQKASGESGVQQ